MGSVVDSGTPASVHRLHSGSLRISSDQLPLLHISYTMSGLSIAEQPRLDASHTSGRFAGQGVIVTGGAGGIGGMIVHRFLSDGAKVAIVDLDPERGAKKIEELKQAGLAEHAKFYKLDVSVRADCFKVVSQIADDLGGIHHLVNCVAYFGSESLGATEEDWDKTICLVPVL